MSLRDTMLKRIQQQNPTLFKSIEQDKVTDEQLEAHYASTFATAAPAPVLIAGHSAVTGLPYVEMASEEFPSVVKAFRGRPIKVQEATPVKRKGEDGKERPGFETALVALAPEHILSAKNWGHKLTITTIDGRRHELANQAR